MTHDFAKDKKTKSKSKKQAFSMPPWLLLMTGIAIGLFVNLLFNLADMGPLKHPKDLVSAAEKLKHSAALEVEKHQTPRQNSGKNTDKAGDKNPGVNETSAELSKFTHKPRFDFYTILPEQEAFVPNIHEPLPTDRTEATTRLATKTAEQTASSKDTFFLQTGSFRDYSDAHKLKGELILVGLNVKIQTVTLGSGETWHRVQVGPFQSERALAKAQNTLAKINIDSMVLKQKT